MMDRKERFDLATLRIANGENVDVVMDFFYTEEARIAQIANDAQIANNAAEQRYFSDIPSFQHVDLGVSNAS